MNVVCEVGYLGKQGVELKFTPGNGKAVATFSLSVEKTFTKGDKKEYNFIPCKVWGGSAEWLANNQDKIKKLSVVGSLNTFTWEKEGVKKYGWEVNVNPGGAQVVEWNNNEGGSKKEPEIDGVTPVDDMEDIPF